MSIVRIAILLVSLSLCGLVWGQARVTTNIEILHGIVYRTVDGNDLMLDLYRPDDAAPVPVVLAIHGGSWLMGSRADLRPFYEQLAATGYAVAAIDYRLAPRHIFPAQLEDARAATEWVRAQAGRYRFDTQRFFVLGASAGGQLAGLLGTQPETSGIFAGVITLAAPMDFTVKAPTMRARVVMQMYLGAEQDVRPDLYAVASPITHITPDDPPFLIMHGEADPYVPPSQSTSMAEALRRQGVPVELLLLPRLGHEVPALNSPVGIVLMNILRNFLTDPRAVAGVNAAPVAQVCAFESPTADDTSLARQIFTIKA